MRLFAGKAALVIAPALGLAGGAAIAAAPAVPAVAVVAHAAPHAAPHTLADGSGSSGTNMYHHG
jgi:hypothetical protein